VPGIALAVYVAFFAVGLGWRAWLQYRRTRDHGIRGFAGRRGSVEWIVGVVLGAGATLTGVAAVTQLADLVDPAAIYSGGLLAAVGYLLMVPNVLSAVAVALLLVGLQIEVRRVEEPYLTRVHGKMYLAYARTVGRFLPGMGHL
jgi:hypothetical protein